MFDSLRWLERLLLACAVVSLGYFGYVQAETFLYQRYEERELDALLSRSAQTTESSTTAPQTTAPGTRPSAPPSAPLPQSRVLGRIEIPRLGVSTIVRAGIDGRTLRLAVGHIPGTALPGAAGNMGLAAHRDTFFRRLKDIRDDDEIRVVTPEGTYRYRVAGTQIVNPQDVWVLDPTTEPTLTLVTCYPFTYLGSSPQRFIVRAERLDAPIDLAQR